MNLRNAGNEQESEQDVPNDYGIMAYDMKHGECNGLLAPQMAEPVLNRH